MKKKADKASVKSTGTKKDRSTKAVPCDLVAPDEKPIVHFPTTDVMQCWLAESHYKHTGVWIRFFKVGSGYSSVTYAEALDVALCYGWIDGPVRKGDELSWLHKFTPRRKRSIWSQKNKQHVERLISEGRMHTSGLAEVAAAQSDGRWDAAYASSSTFVESPEFLAALKKSTAAAIFYATLSKANRYAFYFRLHTVKRAETRARKITEFIAMLERGETIH